VILVGDVRKERFVSSLFEIVFYLLAFLTLTPEKKMGVRK